VGIDLLGKFPKSHDNKLYVVVFTDHCTRFVITGALEDIRAETVAKFFIEKVLLIFGAPRKMLSDQGKQFVSALMQSILDLIGTDHVRTSAYHAQTNSIIENFNKILATMLSMYCNTDQMNWSDALPYVTFAYNSSRHESARNSPHFLLFGREARLPSDIAMNLPINDDGLAVDVFKRIEDSRYLAKHFIEETQQKNKSFYDNKRQEKEFFVGDKVMVYTPVRKVGRSEKFLHRFFGPFQITEVKSPVNVRVEHIASKRREVVHICRLKKFFEEFDENIDNIEESNNDLTPTSEQFTDNNQEINKSKDETQFKSKIKRKYKKRRTDSLINQKLTMVNENIGNDSDKKVVNKKGLKVRFVDEFDQDKSFTTRYG
jgi:hypothetical protein